MTATWSQCGATMPERCSRPTTREKPRCPSGQRFFWTQISRIGGECRTEGNPLAKLPKNDRPERQPERHAVRIHRSSDAVGTLLLEKGRTSQQTLRSSIAVVLTYYGRELFK